MCLKLETIEAGSVNRLQGDCGCCTGKSFPVKTTRTAPRAHSKVGSDLHNLRTRICTDVILSSKSPVPPPSGLLRPRSTCYRARAPLRPVGPYTINAEITAVLPETQSRKMDQSHVPKLAKKSFHLTRHFVSRRLFL